MYWNVEISLCFVNEAEKWLTEHSISYNRYLSGSKTSLDGPYLARAIDRGDLAGLIEYDIVGEHEKIIYQIWNMQDAAAFKLAWS